MPAHPEVLPALGTAQGPPEGLRFLDCRTAIPTHTAIIILRHDTGKGGGSNSKFKNLKPKKPRESVWGPVGPPGNNPKFNSTKNKMRPIESVWGPVGPPGNNPKFNSTKNKMRPIESVWGPVGWKKYGAPQRCPPYFFHRHPILIHRGYLWLGFGWSCCQQSRYDGVPPYADSVGGVSLAGVRVGSVANNRGRDGVVCRDCCAGTGMIRGMKGGGGGGLAERLWNSPPEQTSTEIGSASCRERG
jgi:hypothetical protein